MLNRVLGQIKLISSRPESTSVSELSSRLCPYAIGLRNAGIVIPPEHVFNGNEFSSEYVKRLSFVTDLGVDYWLQIISRGYEQGLGIEQILLHHATGGINQRLPVALYTPSPEAYELRMCSIRECIMFLRLNTTEQVLEYLYHMVAFGVYLSEYAVTNIFKLQNVENFLAARLFQGEMDAMISSDPVSSFLYFSGTPTDSRQEIFVGNQLLQQITEAPSPEEVSNLVRMVHTQATQVPFLSASTPLWEALYEAKQLNFSSGYNKYLTHKGPHSVKVNQDTFHKVTHGMLQPGHSTSMHNDIARAEQNVRWHNTLGTIRQRGANVNVPVIPKVIPPQIMAKGGGPDPSMEDMNIVQAAAKEVIPKPQLMRRASL